MIEKPVKASPSPSASFRADVERAVFSLNSAFDPLHKECLLDFHVSGRGNGYVYLSFAMPEGMMRAFVSLLQSLHGFFRFAELKTRVAGIEAKALDPGEIEKRRLFREQFESEVCSLFDGFRSQGLDQKEAVKATNRALKAKNHPWANHETVSRVLRGAGRFRRPKGS
jgi:hypothetical protein